MGRGTARQVPGVARAVKRNLEAENGTKSRARGHDAIRSYRIPRSRGLLAGPPPQSKAPPPRSSPAKRVAPNHKPKRKRPRALGQGNDLRRETRRSQTIRPLAKSRLRGGETSTRDCHSGEAVSPTRATRLFARPANGPPTTTLATTIGALVREPCPHPQPRLNRGCGESKRIATALEETSARAIAEDYNGV